MDLPYVLRRAADWFPSLVAVQDGARSLTYRQLDDRAQRLANAIHGLGIARGDTVAVLLPNRLEYPEIDSAIAYGGYVRVALNTRLGLNEYRYTAEDSGTRLLISDAGFDEVAARLVDELGLSWIRLGDDPGPDRAARSYERVIEEADGRRVVLPSLADAPAWISYTSGTTGTPKGVVLSHRALVNVTRNISLELGPVEPGRSVLLPQPLSHGAGYFSVAHLASGATVRIMDAWDPDEAMAIGHREGVATLKCVPTMLTDLVEVQRGGTPFDTIIYGAAPMTNRQIDQALDRFGPVLIQIYGQSEAPVTITCLSKQDHVADGPQRGSVGRAWRSVAVEVRDADGAVVAPGELGEVVVQGDHLMDRYHNLPELTREVRREDAVWTRDMATMDERGFIYLKGRRDDMINSGGFNISPKEVEDVLTAHPAVKECAVFGVSDPKWGQTVQAFVVRAEGHHVTPEELDDFCKPLLGFRRPKAVVFVDELARTSYGKVDRSALKAIQPS